jgi:predicted PurR-regulated permease PerM
MDPKIWGPPMWTSLLNIAKGFPQFPNEKQEKQYLVFFTTLGYVLPCETCKSNYQSHIKQLPPNTSSQEALKHWLHQVYNLTLKDQNRKFVSYEDFISRYGGQSGGSLLSNIIPSKSSLTLLVILIVIALGYYYLVHKKSVRL